MNTITKMVSVVVLAWAIASSSFGLPAIPLAGEWNFQLDKSDVGIGQAWFNRTLERRVQLPGSLPGQGIGDPVTTETPWTGEIVDKSFFKASEFAPYRQPGNIKVPFWLQPETYYAGAAWFQREITIPGDWEGRRTLLVLERPHWETRLWIDGKAVGTNNSLSTPHEYDLGQLPPGRHQITIRVDNRPVVDVGQNSHSISDHTQGNWNGIVGNLFLKSTPLVWIENVQVYPDAATKSARLTIRIGNASGKPGEGTLSVRKQSVPVAWEASGGQAEMTIDLGPHAEEWDEFHPALQHLNVELRAKENDSREVVFGLRNIGTEGTQFTINGRKTFFRGTLECAVFPRTGNPPTDVAEWKRILGVARAHGLNLLRFHSWCPPEAAFVAADEMGFYYQIEIASWANKPTFLGDGKPVDAWLYEEAGRILNQYGNHPSFLMMAYGNEPGGSNHKEWLAKWVNYWKAADPRRLQTSGSGWPLIGENQFHVSPFPRIQGWAQGLKSRMNAKPPETATDYRDYIGKWKVPVVSHEIGEWCVYPNFEEMPKYTGYLKPRNFEIFRDRLEESGLGGLARDFLFASGKLQSLCYKEDIESALRTPGMGGFHLLGLHDFPGQGTALVGVLDPFWEQKGYITPQEYSRFCNTTVPLARLKKRVFISDETLEADVEIAHFGSAPLKESITTWQLVGKDGKPVANGQFPPKAIPVDNGIGLGKIRVDLKTVPAPGQYKLVVSIGGTAFENDWDIWVYPTEHPKEPAQILVTSRFDAAAEETLKAGGKVLLTIPGDQVKNHERAPVKLGFSSIFWNTAWTNRQAPTTLGILCDPRHPAFAAFPTEGFSNWQWWYLVHRSGALRLDLLPKGIKPIVRVIDDWVTARPLGLILEGNVGPGKIVICGFDLNGEAASDPVSRQIRHSLLAYMDSNAFKPQISLTSQEITGLVTVPAVSAKTGSK